jgi:ABC-type multidrug transport system ATPase subunit
MFSDFVFPKFFTDPVGLKPAELRNLGSLVVLAGPNGAGKSRYLRLVPELTNQFASMSSNISWLSNRLNDPKTDWVSYAPPAEREAELTKWKERLRALEWMSTTARWVGQPQKEIKTIALRYTMASDSIVSPNFDEDTTDPNEAPPREVEERAQSNRTGGFESAASSVLAYFHEIARAMYDSEHPRHRNSETVKQKLDDALAFNRVLRALFSAEVELGMNASGRPVANFRGRLFRPGELSEGEQILVIWTILLHRQKEWLRGAQVLIDEPENHLHPDACIRAIEALRSDDILGPEGQIWLATHSVPLIAYAGLDSVYLVDHGSIEYVGNRIEKVIDRLMGGKDGRSRLRALLADADELAFDTFAAQCLLPPAVAAPREGDPQQEQMVNLAREVGANKQEVRILDYSAGRGRLAVALKEAGLTAERKFTYFAYQAPGYTSGKERSECLERIRELSPPQSPDAYLINSLDRLTVPGVAPMDLVVMCNVLHEIPVRQWLECFARIHEVLADDGQLVILEDQLPSVGELPHANGYVILDELALMELFGAQEAVRTLSLDKKGRLTAFGIPRAFLRNASATTICKTLERVKRKAKDELRLLREAGQQQRSFQMGRLHAHYALLHSNALLALDEYQMP